MEVLAIGEPLIEFSRAEGGLWRQGIGGDTLNTAVYLARLLPPGRVGYLTRLGDDALSDGIVALMQAEGIGTDRIARLPGRVPGLYLIETGPGGERRFHYWRNEAPARGLFGAEDRAAERLDAPVIYLSGITLAVIAPEARARLTRRMAEAAAHGALVAYDPNHRPRLWEDAATARAANEAAFAAATLVLPSLEDMGLLGLADPAYAPGALEAAARLTGAEIVLKTGGGAVLRAAGAERAAFPLAPAGAARDTTGAGDSFNAGYIAARLACSAPAEAVATAHRLASRVIAHPGAIIPREAMP